MRNEKGQFVKGYGFWTGKKRPGFKNSTTFAKGLIPFNKGKTGLCSDETILKMSLARLGKPRVGKPENWKRSEKTRKILSILGKKRIGPLSSGYIDGRMTIPGYATWLKNKRNRLKKASSGSHTFEEWFNLKSKYNNTCLDCGRKEPDILITEDHIVPLSKGGSDFIENIQPLCKSCNCRKHDKIINFISRGLSNLQNGFVGGGGASKQIS